MYYNPSSHKNSSNIDINSTLIRLGEILDKNKVEFDENDH